MSNIIGIDVSKLSLDCAWLRNLDQNKAKRKRVENSPQDFKALLTWAQDVSGLAANELRFVVEPTGIYHEFLVQFLNQHQATIYLVNPSMVRKFAAGMGILSKNDLIDADMLTRYGLLRRNLLPYQPEAQEISDLKSLLNRLDTLERDLRRELNRQEKVSKSSTIHRLEKQSIRRTVRYLEAEIKRFKKHIGEAIKSTASLQKDYELLLTIPGIGAKTAWAMLVTLRSRRFASAPEVASYLGLNPIEKQLQGFAPQAARCRVANMIVVKEQVRGQKMPTSHWCVVVNGTRLQEWHARYRRIVTDGMAFTMTSYGSLNIPPPCSPRTHTISDHEVIFDGKQEQKAPFDGDTQQLCWY